MFSRLRKSLRKPLTRSNGKRAAQADTRKRYFLFGTMRWTRRCSVGSCMSSARRASSRDQNVNTVSIPAVKICAVHGVLRLEVHIPNDDGKGVGNWCPRFDIRTLDGMSLESDESTRTWNCCRRLDVTLHVGWKTWNMSLFCFCGRPNPNNPKSKSD
jgi:hypothetical protein